MPEDGAARPLKAAAIASAGCSLLFVVVYSTTNAIAAARGDLPVFFYEWERSIPVVPFLIVPYMSIDAFFVVAPFLCASVREIKLFAKRVCTAILVSGAFFLAWPLQFAFERPQVEGVFGPIFELLHGFDQPHNLFPSLHIALIFILRWTYHRHVRGFWRVVMHTWFALVTVSTVFTLQHHVIDLVGGLVLALLVFYAFPTGLITRRDFRVTRPPSVALARLHGAGALVAAALAWFVSAWTWTGFWLMVWCAFALAAVAVGYGWLGPRVFRKYGGYLSIPTRILLAPYLLALWSTRIWFFRKASRPFAEVVPGVLYGRLPDVGILKQLRERNVRTVLDLCCEHAEAHPFEMDYHFAPMMDLALPEPLMVEDAVQYLDDAVREGPVYVHCALGYERSGLVVAQWLVRSGRVAGLEQAAQTVAAARPEGVSAARLLRGLRSLNPTGRDDARA